MLKVSEVMSRNVVSVDAGARAREAAQIFASHGISGAPVLEHGRIVGVVSKTDLVGSQSDEVRVRDIMTPLVHFVRPEESIEAAVARLLEEKVHRVVVVSADGCLAGVVTPSDILRAERAHALPAGSIWPPAAPLHAVPGDRDF
jgi:CBS-domain-containing membrane protein